MVLLNGEPNDMRHLLWKPIVFVLLLSVGGCSLPDIFKTVGDRGGDAADQAYALISVFNEVDAVALTFAQKPSTPLNIKILLKKLREPARLSVPLIAESAKAYRIAKNQLSTLAAPSTTDEVAAALIVLNNRLEIYSPPIEAFTDYFRSVED